MVTAIDEAIGNITKALKTKGMFNYTLIIFTTDNAGSIPYAGNNYPLRGGKATLFEGGTKATAFMTGQENKSLTLYTQDRDWDDNNSTFLLKPDQVVSDLYEDVSINYTRPFVDEMMLFNVKDDPNEHVDLSKKYPDIVKKWKSKIEYDHKQIVPANYPNISHSSAPSNYGGFWSPGWC